MDSFLAIAEEIKLKGLTGQTSSELTLEKQEMPGYSEPAKMSKDLFTTPTTASKRESITSNTEALDKLSKELVIQDQSGTNLQALDEKVKSMMEKGQKMIHNGKQAKRSSICKVCGKEGLALIIRNHIESNHLEGISISCDYCDKICPSRHSLNMHKSRFHK